MKKRIQIPISLYDLMVEYINDHNDPNDHERFYEIQRGIQNKKDSEERHNIYTSYKKETDTETREILRSIYLDKAGIPTHGRWPTEVEQHFRKGNFDW